MGDLGDWGLMGLRSSGVYGGGYWQAGNEGFGDYGFRGCYKIRSFFSRHQSGSVGSEIAFLALMDFRSFAIVIVALRGRMV